MLRYSLKRSTVALALMLSPMFLMSADCAQDPIPNPPLALDAMRADVTTDGSFVCDVVDVVDRGSRWSVIAQGDETVNNRRFELEIPKKSTVPYTVTVGQDANTSIYYCLPLGGTACKNFYASDVQGGSGTITITNTDGELAGTFRATVRTTSNETRTVSNGEFRGNL
jgi:hypothetical protein